MNRPRSLLVKWTLSATLVTYHSWNWSFPRWGGHFICKELCFFFSSLGFTLLGLLGFGMLRSKSFWKKIKKLKLGNCEKILVSLIFSYCACFIYIYIFLVRFLKILEMFRVGSSFQKFWEKFSFVDFRLPREIWKILFLLFLRNSRETFMNGKWNRVKINSKVIIRKTFPNRSIIVNSIRIIVSCTYTNNNILYLPLACFTKSANI